MYLYNSKKKMLCKKVQISHRKKENFDKIKMFGQILQQCKKEFTQYQFNFFVISIICNKDKGKSNFNNAPLLIKDFQIEDIQADCFLHQGKRCTNSTKNIQSKSKNNILNPTPRPKSGYYKNKEQQYEENFDLFTNSHKNTEKQSLGKLNSLKIYASFPQTPISSKLNLKENIKTQYFATDLCQHKRNSKTFKSIERPKFQSIKTDYEAQGTFIPGSFMRLIDHKIDKIRRIKSARVSILN